MPQAPLAVHHTGDGFAVVAASGAWGVIFRAVTRWRTQQLTLGQVASVTAVTRRAVGVGSLLAPAPRARDTMPDHARTLNAEENNVLKTMNVPGPPISDDAVRKATGRSWAEWVVELDAAGAAALTHPAIARLLLDSYRLDNAWWRQSVTVGYEYAKGRRQLGQVADGRYQVGVSRTLPIAPQALWTLLLSPAGLAIWLGEVTNFEPLKGHAYVTAGGIVGEVRTVAAGKRLRLTYQPRPSGSPSILQVSLEPASGRTTLRFDQERLASASERETMRTHWKEVVGRLARFLIT